MVCSIRRDELQNSREDLHSWLKCSGKLLAHCFSRGKRAAEAPIGGHDGERDMHARVGLDRGSEEYDEQRGNDSNARQVH